MGLAVPARPCLIVGKRVRIRGMRVFKFRSDHRSQNSGPFCPQRTVVSVSRGAGRYRSGSTATPAKRRLEKTLWPSQKRTRPIHAGGVLQVAAQLIGSFDRAARGSGGGNAARVEPSSQHQDAAARCADKQLNLPRCFLGGRWGAWSAAARTPSWFGLLRTRT